MTTRAPYHCAFCGAPSWLHPCDQRAPPDYCHESDHGDPEELPVPEVTTLEGDEAEQEWERSTRPGELGP